MRGTRNMMVADIQYWLARRSEDLARAETVNASGKKVTRPSDDPLAASRILTDRARISQYGLIRSQIDQAQKYIEAGTTVMESVYDFLDQAKDIVLDQSSGDSSTRETMTAQFSKLFDQMVDLANTEYGGSFLFSGAQTSTRPYANESTVAGGTAGDIVFDLAEAAADVQITITDGSGATVRTLTVSGGAAGTNTAAWDGLDDGGAAVADGKYTFTIEAQDSSGQPVGSYPTYRGGSAGKVATIGQSERLSINNDGASIFGSVFQAVSQALASLEASPFSASDLAAWSDDLTDALSGLTREMTDWSMANQRLEAAADRIDSMTQIHTDKLAAEENADETEAALTVQTLATAYEITLETGSMILKTSNLMSLL